MTKIENYKGIDIYEKPDLVGGKYYLSPELTTKKATVNFAPSLKQMKKFIDEELTYVDSGTKTAMAWIM